MAQALHGTEGSGRSFGGTDADGASFLAQALNSKRFTELKAEQQTGARVALQQVDAALRQAVLDEWAPWG